MLETKFKLLFIILFMLLAISCKDVHKSKLVNDVDFIRNLSNDKEFDLPFQHESLMMFICENDIIYVTSLRQLHNLNVKKYINYENFDDFLIKSLNSNLLTTSDLINISRIDFKLDTMIYKDFYENGLEYLKIKYCDKSEDIDKLYTKKNLSLQETINVMYYFFKKNYYVLQNDYSGKNVLIDKNSK